VKDANIPSPHSQVEGGADRSSSEAESHLEITAIVLTYNEAKHISLCVESLEWADRIVVFDSFSDDKTLELASVAGAETFQSPFQNYAQQRNAALDSIATDWVFFVDADERGTSTLGKEIRQVMKDRPEVGWNVPRHNYIFGRLTLGAGWFPDYQLRLFQHGLVRYERPVHELAVVDGEIGYLKNPLIHHNYQDPAHFHAKQKPYTAYDAEILKEQGIRPKFYSPMSQSLRHFWWRFITLKGYQDGSHGFRLSLYMAYYEWLKYQKLSTLRSDESNTGL